MTSHEEMLLVYDTHCPACDNYCRWVRVKETAGDLKLVDAREPSAVMDEITARGMDIDQGMVLKMGGRLYYGPDAVHALSLLSSRSGFFNRLNFWIFRSRWRSKLLYPVLRSCRNLLLKILRVSKINNLGLEGRDRF